MIILDGKKRSKIILTELKKTIDANKLKLKLVSLQIGENSVSEIFLRNKKEIAEKIGIEFIIKRFSKDTDIKVILNEIKKLNIDKTVHGIMVQYPIPENINNYKLIKTISAKKDVEGISPLNRGLLDLGINNLISPTAEGVLDLLENYKLELVGKNVLLLGYGDVTNKPMTKLLLMKKATITICNKYSKNINEHLKLADIIISAVGKPNLFTDKVIKNGVIIIGVGIHYEAGKPKADFEFNNVAKKAKYIAPIPGGTGPMTIAFLFKNLITCYYLNNNEIL